MEAHVEVLLQMNLFHDPAKPFLERSSQVR